MSKSSMKKEVSAESEKFADLYRDIRGQFLRAAGKLHKVVLRHVRIAGKDGSDQDVSQWDADHFEGKDPVEFSAEVVADIFEDSKIFPSNSVQTYGVFFWKTNTTQHSHRIFVRVDGAGADEGNSDVFGSEAADERGRMSQLMRHDEAYTRLALQSLDRTMQSKDAMMELLARQNQAFMTQFIPVLTTVQDILDRTAERDFNLERKRKLYDMLDQGGEKLMHIAPFLIANALKDKKPELSQMILKSVTNPAGDILKAFMTEVEANPEKAGPIFQAFQALPNGSAIIQALGQFHAQQKQEAAQEAAKQQEKEKQKLAKTNGQPDKAE